LDLQLLVQVQLQFPQQFQPFPVPLLFLQSQKFQQPIRLSRLLAAHLSDYFGLTRLVLKDLLQGCPQTLLLSRVTCFDSCYFFFTACPCCNT
jgi:hypothetical protein